MAGEGDGSFPEFPEPPLEGGRRQRRPTGDERPERSGGLLRGPRLDEIPGGAGSQGTVDGAGIVRMGVGDPMGRAPIGRQLSEAVETGLARHRQVDQRDVHRSDGQGLDGIAAILEEVDRSDACKVAEHKMHRIEEEPIVVDERDA